MTRRVTWDPEKGPVLTGVWGDSSDAMREIARLYLVEQERVRLVLDATWGKGVFWKQIPVRPYRLVGMDRHAKADLRASYFDMPFPDGAFDAVIFDPPYKFGTKRNMNESCDGYRNNQRPERGAEAIKGLYAQAMRECHRVVRKPVRGGVAGGLVIVKGSDQVESGRVNLFLHYPALQPCPQWDVEGVFTLASPGGRRMRHGYQDHPRSSCSQFVVLRRTAIDFPAQRPQLTIVEGAA